MLLASFQVYGNEVNVQDVWLRPIASGQGDAMVGMTISSEKHARIVNVISSYYMSVAMQGPAKAGATKSKEVEFIDLPAQKSVVLSAESVHLLLTGTRKDISATNKVPVTLSVQFDDGSIKNVLAMALTPFGKSDVAAPLPAQANAVEEKVVTPAPVKAKEISEEKPKPVAVPKKPVDVKPAKAAPVAEVKEPARAVVPVPAIVAAPVPAPVAPAPVVVAAPVPAPVPVAPVVKPAEQPKQDDARANAECSILARELKECEKANEMMQEWCVTNAKAKYACQLTMEQIKKLK